MCFSPYISLSIFLIEFFLAVFFFIKNPRDKLNRFIALLSFFLGFYQLSEFFICVSGNNLFTRLAMATTAVLPVLGIFYALVMWKKKINVFFKTLILLPTVFFIVMFSLPITFKESAICSTIFIQYPSNGLISSFYGLYYLVYLFGAAVLFYFSATTAKSKYKRRLYYFGMLGMFIFTVPTFIFLIFLPQFKVQFPSVLCEFALLLAIEFIFVLWYKDKHKISF
jgi:hypothetical protein